MIRQPIAAWTAPEADRALLRAALHPDNGCARNAWVEARRVIDFDQPTSEQFRLYPLVARRLEELVPGDPLVPMLRGVARQQAVATLVRLREITLPVAALAAADIGVAVLKGPALALTAYEHIGLRPFLDADLLVHPADHAAARSVLVESGWRANSLDFEGNHAVLLEGGSIPVDLHREPNREMVTPGDQRSAWRQRQFIPEAVDLGDGTRVASLAPADQLVHAIVHGTQLVGTTLSRWIADATMIIRRGDVPWDRVVQLSASFRVAPVVAQGLREVTATTGASVPPYVLVMLDEVHESALDRLRVRSFRTRPHTAGLLGGLPLTVTVHLRRTRHRSALGIIGEAPQFLRESWGASDWSDLASSAGHRALRRVRTARELDHRRARSGPTDAGATRT